MNGDYCLGRVMKQENNPRGRHHDNARLDAHLLFASGEHRSRENSVVSSSFNLVLPKLRNEVVLPALPNFCVYDDSSTWLSFVEYVVQNVWALLTFGDSCCFTTTPIKCLAQCFEHVNLAAISKFIRSLSL